MIPRKKNINNAKIDAGKVLASMDTPDVKGEGLFYLIKFFIGPKLREVTTRNFHGKAPKWVKNGIKVSKIDKIFELNVVSYCTNTGHHRCSWKNIEF